MAGLEEENKVIQFLRKINMPISVIQRFTDEKVDETNIRLASDSQLKELGISTLGDRLRLRDFCENEASGQNTISREEKLEKMRLAISNASRSRSTKRPNKVQDERPKKPKQKEFLKFQLGWKHWDKQEKKYKQKKIGQGGGNRVCEIKREATLEECQEIALRFFFPNGKSTEGNQSDMYLAMGNYRGDLLGYLNIDGKLKEFTAGDYKATTGLNMPRLYLLSKSGEDFENEFETEDVHENSDGDDDLMTSVFAENTEENLPQENLDESQGIQDSGLKLIGTSAERQQFNEELSRLVKESEETDRRKEAEKNKDEKVDDVQDLEILRKKRESRVPPEPTPEEKSVAVCIRHPNLGRLTRKFAVNSKMHSVYDWSGSLSLHPKYFSLAHVPGKPISPDEDLTTVSGNVLMMIRQDEPMPFSKDDDVVTFYDGQDKEEFHDDTILTDYFPFEEVEVAPPQLLMEDDEPLTEKEKHAVGHYKELSKIRQAAEEKLVGAVSVEISRDNVVKDLMKAYEDEEIVEKKVLPLVYRSCGDGVLREIYSLFWEDFIRENCDGSSQFTIRLLPDMSNSYIALGRIITHQFVQCQTFPVQLAKASVLYALFGNVSEECLIASFLQLLPLQHRLILEKALDGEVALHVNEIVDILDDYNEKTFPTTNNIKALIKNIATMELVFRPYIALSKIREGMGSFWINVTPDMVESIYILCEPTPVAVVKSLVFSPTSAQQTRVFKWLKRYLIEADNKVLTRFLHFCCASQVLIPGRSISIRMESMAEVAMRPKSQTCFNLLTIPDNYQTYHQLKENLDVYLFNLTSWDLTDF